MRYKIEAIDQALVITDTQEDIVILDIPRATCYFDAKRLSTEGIIDLYGLNISATIDALIRTLPKILIGESLDPGGVDPYTITSFTAFGRGKLGEGVSKVSVGTPAEISPFGEQLTSLRTSQLNLKPTWGATTYRYKKTTTGVGASAAETLGEFRLQTGTATTNIANLETNQRGQYQAGTMGQVGVAFRIPTPPTGTQYAKWGYSDFVESGFYFGIDATGVYVAYLTGGVETKVYQTAWNGDVLDGTGASGFTLTPSNGLISQIDFTWYGYGSIAFSFLVFNTVTLKTEKVLAHTIKVNGSVSIIDPNQPLKFEVGNGANSTTDFSLYIGGHQFSIIDGNSIPQKRSVSELLTNYTTATNTDWQPIIAIRKKATFNGRPNSVNVYKEQVTVSSDGEMEVRVTSGGTTSNLTWGTPTGVDVNETAIETKVTSGTALTTSVDGNPLDYGFVFSNNKSSSSFDEKVSAIIGAEEEIIIWIRRLSASGVVIVKHAHITVNEEW